MKRAIMAALCVCLLPVTAPAVSGKEARPEKEVRVDPQVTAVTVYPDRAAVTRTAVVPLPKGASTVLLEGLAGRVFENSLRVSAEGTGDLIIVSVETRKHYLTAEVSEAERKLSRELEQLNDKKRTIADAISALNDQLGFIRAIATAKPGSAKEGMLRDDPAKWAAAWKQIGAGSAETQQAIQQQRIAARELQREIERVQRELRKIRTGKKEQLDVRVHLSAPAAGKAKIAFDYQVSGASWRPAYDARLNVAKSRVNLVQRADVTNRSGEDWHGVMLTLSTARPARGVTMPFPKPWFVDFPRPEEKRLAGLVARDTEGFFESCLNCDSPALVDARPATGAFKVIPDASEERAKRAEEQVATAVGTEFTAEYAIKGAQDVPSDGEPHTFTVAEHTLPAALFVRTYPKQAATAFLYAGLTFDGKSPLLGGKATIFRDGVLMGSSTMQTLRPGEEIKLSFGVDDRVRVAYGVDTDLRSKTGLIGKRNHVVKGFIISVENFHATPVDVTVFDRMPVPQNEEIRVRLTSDSTPPTERDVDDRKGVLAWKKTLKPNQQADIRFGYEVSYPRGKTVPGL